MRQRERLDDFRGGHVACRVCKRLMYFDHGTLLLGNEPGYRCCGIAYVPERRQVDLVIYDRLDADDFAEALPLDVPEPVAVHASEDPVLDPSAPEPEDVEPLREAEESELEQMVATAEQAEARRAERVATLKARQGR